MGIKHLIDYISSDQQAFFHHYISGKFIYVSKIIYFDMTYKLIEIFNKCTESFNFTDDIIGNYFKIISIMADNLISTIKHLKYFDQTIYIFVDKRYISDLPETNVLFSEFITKNYNFSDEYERHLATPIIKRKYLSNLTLDKIDKIRNTYEVISVYKTVKNKIANYISIPYLLSKDPDNEILKKFITHGWIRYLLLRNSKKNTIQRRAFQRYSFINKRYNGENINRMLLSASDNQKEMVKNHIPFISILYGLKYLCKEVLEQENVKFFGCEFESDFAIVNHINKYSRNIFPTIYTSDTDLVALLCDVNCTIRLTKNKKSISINPQRLFENIFKKTFTSRHIKTMCVLLGTDYNPYNEQSPIHISSFDEVLDLTEEELSLRVFNIMDKNKNNIYCQQTAIALNIYLNNIEHSVKEINMDEEVDVEKFIRIVNWNMLDP
jgi:5'-3' exonuclease